MPLRKVTRILRPELLTLRSDLEAEWRNPRSGRTAEPVIYEVDPGTGESSELYVVWSRWEGVPANERAEIILDTFEAVRGKDDAMRVGMALGLTFPEAGQFNLPQQGTEAP